MTELNESILSDRRAIFGHRPDYPANPSFGPSAGSVRPHSFHVTPQQGIGLRRSRYLDMLV
jgi:hypothetical protein